MMSEPENSEIHRKGWVNGSGNGKKSTRISMSELGEDSGSWGLGNFGLD